MGGGSGLPRYSQKRKSSEKIGTPKKLTKVYREELDVKHFKWTKEWTVHE